MQDHQSIRNYLASRKEAVTAELAAIREYKEKLEEECEFWRGREESFKGECIMLMAQTPLQELKPVNTNSSLDASTKSLIKKARQLLLL